MRPGASRTPRPSPRRARQEGCSRGPDRNEAERSPSGCGASSGCTLAERVLEESAHLKRDPFARVYLRRHPVRVRRACSPAAASILARQQPGDRGLRAIVAERARRVERPKDEEHVGLIEERERQLPPEIARAERPWIPASLHAIGKEELDPPAQRALDLAGARRVGERGETPEEARVSPRARLVSVDRARGVELLRVPHESLDQWLEAFVVAIPRERHVADDVAGKTGDAVVALQRPPHSPHPR